MKYSIQYTYDTGNSFHNEYGLVDTLELTWENLDIVKSNLQRIKEHYEYYSLCNKYRRSKEIENVIEQSQHKDWFVNMPRPFIKMKEDFRIIDKTEVEKYQNDGYEIVYKPDDYYARHCIKLLTDKNTWWQISAPWCGYFETLTCVEIISDDSDMKIQF